MHEQTFMKAVIEIIFIALTILELVYIALIWQILTSS